MGADGGGVQNQHVQVRLTQRGHFRGQGRGLDRAWLRAVEIAADDRSVTDELAAADLASALIKVGTESAALTPQLGMSLVPEADAPVSERVRRLLAWKSASRSNANHFALGLLFLQAAVLAASISWLIPQMHRFTEFLIQ